MNVSRPFIERPIATSLLAAAILIAGVAAYMFLAVAPLPRVDFPTISVNAALPGASPETMASAVATPLERRRHRRCHRLRARPGQVRVHLDGREVDARQRRHRQEAVAEHARD
ncbi:MAG: efflux RND transporter permease subunit, partial [Polyangiaceae bacterium]